MKRYSLKNTNDRLEKWDKNKDGKISWGEYLANFNAAGNVKERKEQMKFDERRFNVRWSLFYLYIYTYIYIYIYIYIYNCGCGSL